MGLSEINYAESCRYTFPIIQILLLRETTKRKARTTRQNPRKIIKSTYLLPRKTLHDQGRQNTHSTKIFVFGAIRGAFRTVGFRRCAAMVQKCQKSKT